MFSLLRFYFELCLLRTRPQDLPTSQTLLIVTAVANVAVGTASVTPTLGNALSGFLASILDTLLMTGFIWLVLNSKNKSERFLQAATAALGISLILTGVSLPLQMLIPPAAEGTASAGTASLLFLGLVVWVQIALGHVLRHALDTGLLLGVGLAFAYSILSGMLIQMLFLTPGAAVGGG
jgi:hypothetical protein